MNIRAKLPVYEVDGADTTPLDGPRLVVESHWNYTSRLIVLCFDNGTRYTVSIHDLETALDSVKHS